MKHISRSFIRNSYPKKNPWSRKGDFGRLLVIGGSRTYSGAPALVALAAMRSGCDLVTVAAPERAANIIASFSPDLITEPMAGNHITNLHTPKILELSEHADSVVIGNGLGRENDTALFIRTILSRIDKPCVIDADAISAVSKNKKLIKKNFIITPHSGEFHILSGIKPSKEINERSKQVRNLSKELGCTIILKGHADIISDSKNTLLNSTGNPYMTKGGTGDTLAGICGAFLAMGMSPFNAACSSAYMNGLAGELAHEKFGSGFLASDIMTHISIALKKILR